MMRFALTSVIYALLPMVVHAQTTPSRPDLLVRTGEIKTLPSRTYQIGTLIIEPGGILKVPENQSQWLIIDVAGDARIDGQISFNGMIARPTPIVATAPDGSHLEFQYPQGSNGGQGGHGGQCGGMGGRGASGTNMTGGGGGGGGFNGTTMDPHYHVGDNATTFKGAVQYGRGGDGGRRSIGSNGGLIYIAIKGSLKGSGTIDVSGTKGADGQNGSLEGFTSMGANGGGGGASGGDGGYVKISARSIESQPSVRADGGKGGAGGRSLGSQCLGREGDRGDPGASGYSDITIDESSGTLPTSAPIKSLRPAKSSNLEKAS